MRFLLEKVSKFALGIEGCRWRLAYAVLLPRTAVIVRWSLV